MRRPRAVLAVAVTGLLLSGCGSQGDGEKLEAGATAAPAASTAPSASPEPTAAEATDPASIGANELGKVPVMMYHQVKVGAKGEYDQTPDEFRKELERMYKADFRPVTVRDFIAGKIDIPAGKHALVMTFDDSSPSEAQIGPDGAPVADTALGILEAFGKEHPDFKPTASFYVNASPFNDPKVLPWLAEHGYEVGVHTRNHSSLKALSDSGVQEAIGLNAADIEKDTSVKPTTISLPFGQGPSNKALLRAGTFDGGSYTLAGALLVGSNPSPSPFSAAFDPYAVPRIRSGPKAEPVLMDSNYWLDSMAKTPKSLFTSDGHPDKISYPVDSAIKIADKWKDKANPYSASGASSSTESAAPTASPGAVRQDLSDDEAGSTSSPTPSS